MSPVLFTKMLNYAMCLKIGTPLKCVIILNATIKHISFVSGYVYRISSLYLKLMFYNME